MTEKTQKLSEKQLKQIRDYLLECGFLIDQDLWKHLSEHHNKKRLKNVKSSD
jgi:ribosomal protein S13